VLSYTQGQLQLYFYVYLLVVCIHTSLFFIVLLQHNDACWEW